MLLQQWPLIRGWSLFTVVFRHRFYCIPKCWLAHTQHSLIYMPKSNVNLTNNLLRQVSVVKYLSMDRLISKWDEHIGKHVPKISAKIDIWKSLRKIIPTDIQQLLYSAIVLAHFVYSDIVYDTATETNKAKLQYLICYRLELQGWSQVLVLGSTMFYVWGNWAGYHYST